MAESEDSRADTSRLSVTQAAQLAGVSTAYVRRLVSEGVIRGHKMGWVWAVERASLERWIENRRRKQRR